MRVRSVHVALGHDGKLGAHFHSRELYHLFGRLLVLQKQELGAGESDYLHAVLLVLVVDVDQLHVGLVGEGSLRRQIHDDDQLAPRNQLAQTGQLAFNRRERVLQYLLPGRLADGSLSLERLIVK